jgi:putative CocE/NonD family hydrolase
MKVGTTGRVSAAAAVLALALGSIGYAGTPALAVQAKAATPARTIEHQPIAMRDGVKLDATISLPAGAGPFPVVLVRTPYPITPPTPGHDGGFMGKLLDHGYAIVNEYERGMYWSEGRHTYMARAKTDGYDTIDWIVKQPWSTGNVGTYGCSSTAENQLGLIASNHPAHKAAIVLGFGAGIGRIGPYAEQGNLFRGGALQLLFSSWNRYYIGADGAGGEMRPTFPSNLSQEERARLGNVYTIAIKDFAGERKASATDMMHFYDHLPSSDILKAGGGVPSGWEEFARRTPGDPRWSETDFINQGDTLGVPAIWGVSWYDVSVGPNLFLYDYARQHVAPGRAPDQQWLIVSPGTHCSFQRTEGTDTVGDMPVGDARYDFDQRFIDFFDWKLKGIDNGVDRAPRVQTYQMGDGRWVTGDSFPVVADRPLDLYLSSSAGANSLFGDGTLEAQPTQSKQDFDRFVYDPLHPVQTAGGGLCCMGPAILPGGFDQSNVEARQDVLVYSTPPLAQATAVRGPIEVELYVGSSAPDTDFTVKLVDVHPDGKAYNLTDTIFRARYRDGYDRQVMMKPGQVYKLRIPPMFTGNTFLPGHRIRVEISSSNFPLYDRNLNSGGKNAEETKPVRAVNTIYHSRQYPSKIRLNLYKP